VLDLFLVDGELVELDDLGDEKDKGSEEVAEDVLDLYLVDGELVELGDLGDEDVEALEQVRWWSVCSLERNLTLTLGYSGGVGQGIPWGMQTL